MVHQLVEGLERDFLARKNEEEKDSLVDQAIFILVAFLAALRGEEVLKLVLGETRTYFAEARRNTKLSRVVLKTGERYHFVVVTARSNSGLRIGDWMKSGIESRERRVLFQGYFFTNKKGGTIRARDLEVDILDRITRIQQEHPDLKGIRFIKIFPSRL